MHSTLFTTTLFFALAILHVAADFTVYTPVLTQCQPATLNWDNTNGPYDVIIVPASDTCGDELADLGEVNTNTVQWPVSIPAGTEVVISVLDANNQEGWSGSITVQPSNDNSCLTSSQNTPPSNPTPQPPTKPSSTSSTPPAATIVGAANNGLMNGDIILRFNGVAAFVTALGALAALL